MGRGLGTLTRCSGLLEGRRRIVPVTPLIRLPASTPADLNPDQLAALERGQRVTVDREQLERQLVSDMPSLAICSAQGTGVRSLVAEAIAVEARRATVIASKPTHEQWREILDRAVREVGDQSEAGRTALLTPEMARGARKLPDELIVIEDLRFGSETKTFRALLKHANATKRTITLTCTGEDQVATALAVTARHLSYGFN